MNLGAVLRSARTAAGISLEDLAALTSIRTGLISEMESNNFSHCGGDIYARGHLRNIAPKIGLDANSLVEMYNHEHSVESRSINEMLAENSVVGVPQEKRNLSWKVPAAFSLGILFLLFVGQIIFTNINSNDSSPTQPSAVASSSASPTPEPTSSASPTVSPVGEGVTLTISAVRGNSLIDIVIDGVHVEKGSIFQGESKTFTSPSSISIYFSNPAGLDVTVNGELLPPLGGQNEEVRRTFR